jgi:hypothetical protein
METIIYLPPVQHTSDLASNHESSARVYSNLYVFIYNLTYLILYIYVYIHIYRVSQEECAKLWESVPYVKVYRYNPKHLNPKLNGYGDNGQRKVGASCSSTYCTC